MKKFIDYCSTKHAKRIIVVLLALALLFGVFHAGVFVGFHKASFAFRGGENYYRAFDRNTKGMIGRMQFDDIPGGHGAAGKVVSVASTTVVVSSRDNTEKIIHISKETLIKKFREEATLKDIVVGDFVVVVGNPNENGAIEAKLVRILPAPENNSEATTTKRSHN